MNSTSYENDFYSWTQEQAHLLKTKQLHQIDWQNIAEEIEDIYPLAISNYSEQDARTTGFEDVLNELSVAIS